MQISHEIARNDAVAAPGLSAPAPFLSAYAMAIKRYEFLEPGQEQQLARRWQETRDRSAANALVTSHLRIAAKVARGYKGYGLPLVDLIAEANLGLVIAASRFEPDRGARFSTYAVPWIKASLHAYILRSWSLVKIGTTAAQKKLFFRLRGEMRKVMGGAMAQLTPDVATVIAEKLDVTARDVIEMDSRLNGDMSLNARVGGDEHGAEWETLLVDETVDAETVLADREQTERRTSALRAALGGLRRANATFWKRGGWRSSPSRSISSDSNCRSPASASGRSRSALLPRSGAPSSSPRGTRHAAMNGEAKHCRLRREVPAQSRRISQHRSHELVFI